MKTNYNRRKVRVAIDGDTLVFYCVQCSSVFARKKRDPQGALFTMLELDSLGSRHILGQCEGDTSKLTYGGEIPPNHLQGALR